MKISYKSRKNRYFIILLVIAVVSCFITSASYSGGVSSIAASVLGFVVSPAQKLVSKTHVIIDELSAYFEDMDALIEENDALQKEITELRRKVSELEPAAKENEMLYNFLELKKERTDIKFVNADIISRSTSNYISDFTIDKGSVHGIKKDMAVVTDDSSLLGIIVEVGATYSRGKTLTSYDFSVGIKNERTGEPGLLSGDFELSTKGFSRVADLYSDADYQTGDIICTSGLGDLYPAGLYVGSVREIIPNKLDYTVSAVVEPSISVLDTDMVMVITDFDRSFEENSEQPEIFIED